MTTRRYVAAGAALCMVLAGAAPARAGERVPDCPTVVSHRTEMLEAPENTVPGIEAAGATESPMVEVDVQWSSSAFPVLMHDQTVDRTTNGTGSVIGKGLGQLRALKAQDYAPWSTDVRFTNTKVPYGWEFMEAAADADLDILLELGATPSQLAMEKLVYYIDAFDYRARSLIMAPADRVATVRAWYPTLRYVVIEYPPSGMTRTGESLLALGAEGYALPSREIQTPALVAYYHSYETAPGVPLKVFTWTSDSAVIDTPASWDRVTAAGVDYLITNRTTEAIDRQPIACPA